MAMGTILSTVTATTSASKDPVIMKMMNVGVDVGDTGVVVLVGVLLVSEVVVLAM